MLMFLGEFWGGPKGTPQENFNIFNISPVLSTFWRKMCLKQGNVKDVKVQKMQNLNLSREMLKMLKMLMFF